MKRNLLIALALIGLLCLPAPARAGDEAQGCELAYLFNGWARATVEGAPNSAAYGLLVNLSAEDDRLLSATTDAAEAVELHEVVMGEGDVMQMRPVEGGFSIPAGGYLELKPGGLHIMLINLTQPLTAGETLDLTLHFERGGEMALAVPVRDAAMDGAMSETGMDAAMPGEEEAAPPMAAPWGEACAGIHVVGGWVRATVPGMPTSAAYGLLLNLTGADDVLTGAATDAAQTVELHEVVMGEGDVMQMRTVEGGIPLPDGEAVLLRPGDLHIMLIGLAGELPAGDDLGLTLTFAEADDMQITLPVREPEMEAMAAEREA